MVREETGEVLVEVSGAAAEEAHEVVVEAGPEEVVEVDVVEVVIAVVAGTLAVESGHAVDNTASSTVSA